MKHLAALALVLMSSSSYAVKLDSANTMGAEKAPRRYEENAGMTDRKTYNTSKPYGSEMTDDTISTGQSSTKRNSMDTPAATTTKPAVRCVDRSGYSYYKNDAGYAACVNQSSRHMRTP